MARQIIAGYLFGDLLFTMYAAQRRLDHRQSIVGHQRHTETEQRRFGLAERVELGMQMRLKLLKGRLDLPAMMPP